MSIAVGYIPTEAGERALTAALDRAARDHTSLTIINIERLDRPGDRRHASAAQLATALERARALQVKAISLTRHTRDGDDFVDTFLDAVHEQCPELLVIGTRTDAELPAHMRSHTIQHIVADSPCSVLIV